MTQHKVSYVLKFSVFILLSVTSYFCFGESKPMSKIAMQVKVTESYIKVGASLPLEIRVTNKNIENNLVKVNQGGKFEFHLQSKNYGNFVISKELYERATYIYGDHPKPVAPQKPLRPGEAIHFEQDISRWYVRIPPADEYQLTVHYSGLHGEQISSQPIPVQIHGIIDQKTNHTDNLDVSLKVANPINLAESFPIEITLKNKDSGNNSVDVDGLGEGVLFEFVLHSKDRGVFIISKAIFEGESNPYKDPKFQVNLKALKPGESITYKMDILQWRKSYIPADTYHLVGHYTALDGMQYSSEPVLVQVIE